MKKEDLIKYGTLLYGEQYKAALSKGLGVNRRTITRWAIGEDEIPLNIANEIRLLIDQKILELRDAKESACLRIPGENDVLHLDNKISNCMSQEQIQDFKSRGLQLSFKVPSYSRYRSIQSMLDFTKNEHPTCRKIFEGNLNKRYGIGGVRTAVVYKLEESDTANTTRYRIFLRDYHNAEYVFFADCVFDHNEDQYSEFLKFLESNEHDAAVTLLANNAYKVYPTEKCNNWQEDEMPSV